MPQSTACAVDEHEHILDSPLVLVVGYGHIIEGANWDGKIDRMYLPGVMSMGFRCAGHAAGCLSWRGAAARERGGLRRDGLGGAIFFAA